MAKKLRYAGEFLSRQGVTWRVELLQEAAVAYATIGELKFEADEPLVIEWDNTDKDAVVCSSEATIRIESPGDRTYEDLYTIEVGSVRMDVYRSGQLYWSGTLDPEFYEEPYEQASHYPVSLSFSDFGILDRLKYNLAGMQTLQAILIDALSRSGINYVSIDANTYCTTFFADDTKANLAALSVRSDNFYDEEGEPSTLLEVVEGMMQPLALRMVQRNGRIWVYDLNGLNTLAPTKQIEWDGDSQTLGVDKVANNVTVSFSPYSSAQLLDDNLDYGGDYSVEDINMAAAPGSTCYSYYPDYSDEHRQGLKWDVNLIDFTIFISGNGDGLGYLNPSARYCHILPLTGNANEVTAVAWAFWSGGHGSMETGWPQKILNNIGKANATVVMKTRRAFLPSLGSESAGYKVRLTLEMLLDTRYNPFTDGNDGNEGGNYNDVKVWTGWAFVPVGVTIYDITGNAICHYVNKPIAESSAMGHMGYTKGTWESGAATYGDAWLEYYSTQDREEDAGIQGWKANRHCIGRPDHDNHRNVQYGTGYRFDIFDSFLNMADGEYMPYPTQGGYMEVTVYAGVNCYDFGEDTDFATTQQWDKKRLYDKMRWLLYKAPRVEVVKNNLVFDEAEMEDVEYTGYINKAAKEEISIDTICGTSNKTCPTAKGIYCRAADNLQVKTLKRAGLADHPERLLIGTLYSQYASRKTTLTGEAVLDPGSLCCYTEQNQGEKLFMLSGEVQDTIADTTEATFVEFSPDEYEAIEEVE
jgi:hypothetical protein